MAVNLFVNFFLLLAVRNFLHLKRRRLRLVLGACVGAAGSLVILLPIPSAVLSLLIKLALSCLIIAASFLRITGRQFIKAVISFYLMSFAFAGIMLTLWYFVSPDKIVVKNSVVYFDISPLLLAVFTVIAYAIIHFGEKWILKHRYQAQTVFVTIRKGGNTVEVTAKLDTGNALREPFSQESVLVVTRKALGVLAEECEKEDAKIRLIPYRDVSGGGVMKAFHADSITIKNGKVKTDTTCYIAVCDKNFDHFDALIHPDLLEEGCSVSNRGA